MVEQELVIIDTDPGIDDALALLFLFSSPQVHVRAITLTHGNAPLDHIKRNAVTLLNVLQEQREMHREKLPLNRLPVLAMGGTPLSKSSTTTAIHAHGIDGLGGIHQNGVFNAPIDWEAQLVHSPLENTDHHRAFRTTDRDAADEILFQLQEARPLSVSILAIAPLTNVALAFQRDPVIFSRVKRVVIMGSAVDGPGNVTPLSEFNFYADPDAANTILEASKGFQPTPEGYRKRLDLIAQGKQAPVHIVVNPLKSAEGGIITFHDYKKYLMPFKTPVCVFCNTFLKWLLDLCLDVYKIDFIPAYDAYTSFLLLDLDDREFDQHWEYRYLDLHVETRGRFTMGMACYDMREWDRTDTGWNDGAPNHVQVITRGNGSRFNRVFLNRVFNAGIKDQQLGT